MNKAEFIDAVAAKAGLSKKDAKGAVDAVLDTITETLVKKESVSFIGFGTFSTAARAERTAKVDYRWKVASIDASIHSTIYTNIHEAKYIAFGVPIYTTAYTFEHDEIVFDDYFGKTTFPTIKVYDPGDYETWYDRNALEITKYLKETNEHIMVIKGIGTYVYDRDINNLIKRIAILENSCRLLSIKSSFK